VGWLHRQGWEATGLFGVVVGGTIARWRHLGDGLGTDEICSVLIAGGDYHRLLAGAVHDAPHPPLYYLALHLWLSLFGTSEVAVRSLSVACSLVFLVVAYKLLRRFVDAPLALGVLCVFAFGSYFVFYGQQARPYALIAMVSAFNLLAFFRALQSEEPGAIRLWGVSAAVLLFSQYMGVLFIACEVFWALLRLRRKGVVFALYGAIAVMSVAAWALVTMGAALSQHHDPIPTTNWMVRPKPANLVWFYGGLFGTAVQLRWLFGVLGGLGAFYLYRAWRRKSLPSDQVFLALLAIGVPLFVFALSLWGPRPLFVPRQLMLAAVAAMVLLATMLAAAPKPVASACVVAMLAFCLLSLPQAVREIGKEPWQQIAGWVDHRFGPVRVVIADLPDRISFAYYRRSGPVIAPKELGDTKQAFLVVCRPRHCGIPGLEASTAPVKRWPSVDGPSKTLLVYRVRPATGARTASLKTPP
jgi:uncharacterized membrane protein